MCVCVVRHTNAHDLQRRSGCFFLLLSFNSLLVLALCAVGLFTCTCYITSAGWQTEALWVDGLVNISFCSLCGSLCECEGILYTKYLRSKAKLHELIIFIRTSCLQQLLWRVVGEFMVPRRYVLLKIYTLMTLYRQHFTAVAVMIIILIWTWIEVNDLPLQPGMPTRYTEMVNTVNIRMFVVIVNVEPCWCQQLKI